MNRFTLSSPNRNFVLLTLFSFALTLGVSACSSKPAENKEAKVSKRMTIEYPHKKELVKKAPKIKIKKVVKKKKPVTTAKPNVKWLSPKKATIKRRAPAKPKPIVLKKTVAKKTTTKTRTKRSTKVSLSPMKGPNYVVSLSSFRERSKATSLAKKLSADGYNAYVTEIVSKGTRWYRVRCGFFAGFTEATRVKDRLEKRYFAKGAWVDKPTKDEVAKYAK